MSSQSSPARYKELDDDFISDANFKVDIGQRMKVPSKISFNEGPNGINQSAWLSGQEALNMQVPERILVVGQQQHIGRPVLKSNWKYNENLIGAKAPPREIVYDNSILPTDPYPGDVRVATPPRTLTLDKYPFPGINDFEEKEDKIPVIKVKNKFNLDDFNDSQISQRGSTPPIGPLDGLPPADEILHLRRQLAKLNRRVMALELENLNRLQKEKVLWGLGIAYFLLKAIIWMNRSNY